MISSLSAIDATVKTHEWSHLLTLGPYAAGPIAYDFIIDSEGNRYAVGGSIAVDLSPVPGDPEATARKARAVLQAAYAPGNPSAADMQVAQKAYLLLSQAEEEQQSKAAAGSLSGDPEKPMGAPPGSITSKEVSSKEVGRETRIGASEGVTEKTDTQEKWYLNAIEREKEPGQAAAKPVGEIVMNEAPSLFGKKEYPAWIPAYAPTGKWEAWYDFWFEREDSRNRGILVSLWA